MADEYEDTEETSEEEEQQPQSSANLDDELKRLRKANRELLKEVKEERKARRDSEFQKLKDRYPNLEPEDIEGIPAAKLEAFLAKVVPSDDGSEEPSKETVPAPEEAEMARFTRQAGGSGAPVAPEKISLADAAKIPWAERRELIKAGRIEGVELPT